MYGRALKLLAKKSAAGSASELAEQAVTLIDYFLNTRGRFTVAVANSFASLRTQLDDLRVAERCVEEGDPGAPGLQSSPGIGSAR